MEEKITRYINKIEEAINKNNEISPLEQEKVPLYIITGSDYSNEYQRFFLNSIVDSETIYLQIGAGRGPTFGSAIYGNNPKKAIAVDDFGGKLFDDGPKKQFLYRIQKIYDDFLLIHESPFKLKDKHIQILEQQKFNVYYYDGPHNTNQQSQCLTYYKNFLDDVFIFIADDFLAPTVAPAIKTSIENSNLKVIKEWHLTEEKWNCGMYVAVLQK